MLNLTTTDSIRVVTSAAADVDVFCSYVDKDGTTVTPGNQATQITTATTTTVVSAPGTGQRNVNVLWITNRDTTDSVEITVEFYDGAATEIMKVGIGPSGALSLDDLSQWTIKPSGVVTKQYLTTPGAGTYTTPVAVTSIVVECVGGGGAGGGCTTAATNSAAAGGGFGGQYMSDRIDNPAASYSYNVGTAGAGASGATGTAGGNTVFGDTTVATTGAILWAYGGAITQTADPVSTIHVGVGGLPAFQISTPGAPGLALAAAQAVSGIGGSPWVYGGGGNARKTQGAGNNAVGFGGGGGGGCILSGGASVAGGNGTAGIIVVTEFR